MPRHCHPILQPARRRCPSLSWFFLLTALLSLPPAHGGTLVETLARLRGGVVAVGTLTQPPGDPKSKPQARYLGTGFAVATGGLVVTNFHVVSGKNRKEGRLAVFSGKGREARIHEAKILKTDREHDLALLEIWGRRLTPLSLHEGGLLPAGRKTAFTGFPLGMVLGLYPVTHEGIIAAVTPAAIPADSSRRLNAARIRRLRNPFLVYQLDAIAYPGNSGSPLYLPENGKVIGVVNSVFVKGSKESVLSTPSGITYAIPVKYVRKLLQ